MRPLLTIHSLLPYLSRIEQGAVRQEALEADGVGSGFHCHVVVRFGLGRYVEVQGMLFPQARVAYVAGDSRKEVKRTRFVSDKIFDMAAVTVGVQVARQDSVYVIGVEDGHKDPTFVAKSFFARFGSCGRIEGVTEYVFMHEDDFPFFRRAFQVVNEPRRFFVQKGGLEVFQFRKLCIHDGEVNVTVVEGVELVRVFEQTVFRQVEEGRV